MKYIKQLQLINFQKHINLKIDFKKGINWIVGESDKGKSAIYRSLKWVFTDKPRGNSFIRRKQKKAAEVIVSVSKHTISRKKSKSTNLYTIDKKEFKNFKTGVPQNVFEVLNITSNNFQGQFEAPFLLSDSPGKVGKHINSLVNLEDIDICLSNLNKAHKTIKQNLSFLESEKKTNEEKLKKLPDIKILKQEFETIKTLNNKIEEDILNNEEMSDLVYNIEKIEKSSIIQKNQLKLLYRLIRQLRETEILKETTERLEKHVLEVNRMTKSQFPGMQILLYGLPGVKRLATVLEASNGLKALVDNIQENMKNSNILGKELKTAKQQFDKVMKNKCPLCGARKNEN
jgi:hypothetical protein